MSTSKLTSKLFKILPLGATKARSACSQRSFVTAAPRPLQAKKDKDNAEACQNVKEAAKAVKESAKEVRKTTQFVRDTVSSTAETVTKMTKDVTGKLSETAETITEKAAEMIKDKIMGK